MDTLKTLTTREEREESFEDEKFPVLLMLTSAEYEYINEIIQWYSDIEVAYDAGDALKSICGDAYGLSSEQFLRDCLASKNNETRPVGPLRCLRM